MKFILDSVLSKKAQDVREDVKQDIVELEKDLVTKASQQKTESKKVKSQIKILKEDKKKLDLDIMGLQRRIAEIQVLVGLDNDDLE